MSQKISIECPKCKGIGVESVPAVYRSLKLSEPGRGLLSDSKILLFVDGLTHEQKRDLLKQLAPPQGVQRPLPAPNIAFMAFLLSWLATSSYFIGKMGYPIFSVMSMILGAALLIPFYLIIRVTTHDFKKSEEHHQQARKNWEKRYFCKNCGNLFTPEPPQTPK